MCPDSKKNKIRPGVTGIGGIFFKCRDKDAVKEWYARHLGFNVDEYGAPFIFHEPGKTDQKAYLQWSPFSEDTDYFEPSSKEFMINYRVNDLDELVENLRKEGVTILDEIEEYDYGRFVHILDNEGNKIELWEPVDEVFTRYYEEREQND